MNFEPHFFRTLVPNFEVGTVEVFHLLLQSLLFSREVLYSFTSSGL